jgi:CheY-like chemotaxis protein
MRAETGPEALELCCLRREYYDLIMVDVQIPFISGIEVIREVRRSRPSLPIIAVTAFSSNDIKRRCYIAGCHEYLVKPIPPGSLLDILKAYLESTRTAEHASMS